MDLSGTPPPPTWVPGAGVVAAANLTSLMAERGIARYEDLHRWTVDDRPGFWDLVVRELGIEFAVPPVAVLGRGSTPERPAWFDGARLNIVDSCFQADPGAAAIVAGVAGGLRTTSYAELQSLVGAAATGLRSMGVGPGARVGIAMPMTLEAVVAYLAIVATGAAVVSIADSFAPHEIETRARIGGASLIVTQDAVIRGGKRLPMYDKVVTAGCPRAIVVATGAGRPLRPDDCSWDELVAREGPIGAAIVSPDTAANILFSSGTTGDPKAIPWTHLTPIKSAMDGRFHQDIHPGDVVAWPTNLGWMMGPWLIFASLLNRATMALYDGAPNTRGFTEFVVDARVAILGVVPSLVAAWRTSDALAGLDWSALRVLSSTGEASNAGDMAWLMGAVGGKPVVEYCGGTEIGGGYITGTVIQPSVAAAFSTPALGLDVTILDETGAPADDGEVFIVPPSVGLSTMLLNRDHHEVYYAGVPETGRPLRRHGDHMRRLGGGYYRAMGRVDDTMNLGGIKVSSAEIERVAADATGVDDVAAVAADPPEGGPSRLVVFAVPSAGAVLDAEALRAEMQLRIRAELNPLFKIDRVVVVEQLPRTASAKVMRRELRRMLEHDDEAGGSASEEGSV